MLRAPDRDRPASTMPAGRRTASVSATGEQHRSSAGVSGGGTAAALGDVVVIGEKLDRPIELAARFQRLHQALLEAEIVHAAPLGERDRQRLLVVVVQATARSSSAAWTTAFAGPFRFGVQYQQLAQREVGDRRGGLLQELTWDPQQHLRFGVGYNFSKISGDEFDRSMRDANGWVGRAQTRY